MRKLFFILSLPLIFSFVSVDIELTKKEREDAVNYFKETQKAVADEIKGMSDNQLKWKPADSVWSITDCVEHIALSEKNLFDWAMGTLKTEANPAKRAELKRSDEEIKKGITDRSFRVKTREGFIPTGQFGDAKQTLKVFDERREALIKYVKETKDDLRNHFAESPFGLVDTYQLLLFLSAHTKRHTLQIEELKANPAFPRQ
ncbi:MAG TPA: DinB family protein [Chitinophagaceae bacterium]